MMPSEKMSVRWSTARPWTCSGDMYGTVPITTPSWVFISVGSSVLLVAAPPPDSTLARPKSSTLTRPPLPTMTLAGFRSR